MWIKQNKFLNLKMLATYFHLLISILQETYLRNLILSAFTAWHLLQSGVRVGGSKRCFTIFILIINVISAMKGWCGWIIYNRQGK